MAGDWIKLECTTPDKPEIVRMAATLRIDQDAVVGKLLRLWVWADQNSVAGESVTITAAFIDRLTNRKGFAAAMRAAGWLIGDDGAMTFPNFDRHNGMTAKMRGESNRRMKKSRETRPDGCGNVAEKSQQISNKMRNQRERREEKSTDHPPGIPPASSPAEDAAPREIVVLPTLHQAREYAPLAGVDPEIAETWWNECESRPLTPSGHFTDRDGNPISKWQQHLTSYGRKWAANDERATRGRRPAPKNGNGSTAPIHTPGDQRL